MTEKNISHGSVKDPPVLEPGAGNESAGTERRIPSEQASGVSEEAVKVPTVDTGQRASGLICSDKPMTRDRVLEMCKAGDSRNTLKLHMVKNPKGKRVNGGSKETHDKHLKRGLNYFLDFREHLQEKGRSGDFHLREFAEFVMEKQSNVSDKTRKKYLLSIRRFMENHDYGWYDIDIDLAEMVDDLFGIFKDCEKTSSERENSKSGNAGAYAKRPIGVRLSDYRLILDYLGELTPSETGDNLTNWMIAGVATGVRQHEWKNSFVETYLDKDAPNGWRHLLHVCRSKGLNDQSPGQLRTLDISEFRKDAIDAVIHMCDLGLKWLMEGTYKSDKLKCNNLLRSVCEKLFPNKGEGCIYTVNNFRQQFNANMKQEYGDEVATALSGHTIQCCKRDYPSKKHAWPSQYISDRPKPHNF